VSAKTGIWAMTLLLYKRYSPPLKVKKICESVYMKREIVCGSKLKQCDRKEDFSRKKWDRKCWKIYITKKQCDIGYWHWLHQWNTIITSVSSIMALSHKPTVTVTSRAWCVLLTVYIVWMSQILSSRSNKLQRYDLCFMVSQLKIAKMPINIDL